MLHSRHLSTGAVSRGIDCFTHTAPRVPQICTRFRFLRNIATARPPPGAGATRQRPNSRHLPLAYKALTTDNYVSSRISERDTIYALSTAAGRAAIAVIRISGPACLDIYQALCPGRATPKPRSAVVRTLYEPNVSLSKEALLDSSALLLYFSSPASATGEDVLELHVHGGPAVVKAVLAAIPRCSTTRSAIRYAEPGEFTHRAFLNGRLDLTQVEALGDALSAETEQQRRMSMRATGGALAQLYEEWRTLLLYARGELEALIDFSEDQHFDESPAELCVSIANQVEALIRRLEIHCQNAVRGEMLRNGISISLLGAPNAGKSSLLNRVIGREAAIVSHEAGTTRDIVEVGLDLGGFYCRLGDTAGLRQHGRSAERMPDMDPSAAAANTESPISQIEQEGMRRAKERATQSDVVIVVLSFECLRDGTDDGRIVLHLDNEVCSTAAQLFDEKNNVIVLINKADLLMPDGRHIALDDAIKSTLQAIPGLPKEAIHFISCQEASSSVNAGGIHEFLGALIQHFVRLTAAASPTMTDSSGPVDNSVWQESLGATERHRMLLQSCLEHLQAFMLQVRGDSEPAIGVLANRLPIAASAHPGHIGGTTAIVSDAEAEMDIVASAEYLRAAADCLGRITGRGTSGDVEDVLGVVFEKFCVGK